ncbi:MAG TPA: thioesterase family protein [Thermoleophilaceae bacterium]|nr:thioesterase family protein [Thermoleophilaceae bacterium]
MDSQIEQDAPATDFDRATALVPLGDGRFAGEVEDGWGAPPGPNGGYLAAILTRALEHGLAPSGERQLRTLATHYLRPSQPGPIEVAIETIRSGKRFSTGRATAFQNGREVMTALGALSTTGLPAAATWSPELPAVASAPTRDAELLPSEDYRPGSDAWLATTPEMPSIVSRVKIAPRLGDKPFSGRTLPSGEAAETGGWIQLPTPRRIDAAYIVLLSDVWWPPSLEPLTAPAIAPTIDLTVHIRADLPPGGLPDQAVLGRFRTAAAVHGTMEEDGELFLADGTLVAQSRQLALLAPFG